MIIRKHKNKKYLSHRLGVVLIDSFKNWYRDGLLKLPIAAIRTVKNFKKGK